MWATEFYLSESFSFLSSLLLPTLEMTRYLIWQRNVHVVFRLLPLNELESMYQIALKSRKRSSAATQL